MNSARVAEAKRRWRRNAAGRITDEAWLSYLRAVENLRNVALPGLQGRPLTSSFLGVYGRQLVGQPSKASGNLLI